jgi:precorrin-2/cobalt-factor-2 C20-methyltransferase
MKGTFYGIGVGPGDPELLTLKAIKAIHDCCIIAVPDAGAERQTALTIAREYVGGKPLMSLDMPMTHDRAELDTKRMRAADLIQKELDDGKNVGFLTLGDPMLYSTYSYLHRIVKSSGYATKVIPGVTSFCAAAAALGEPLCEGGEGLHIIPASYGDLDASLSLDGTKVLMKSGKKLGDTINMIRDKKLLSKAMMAERVSMSGERLVRDLSEETDSGYFSIIIVKGESD